MCLLIFKQTMFSGSILIIYKGFPIFSLGKLVIIEIPILILGSCFCPNSTCYLFFYSCPLPPQPGGREFRHFSALFHSLYTSPSHIPVTCTRVFGVPFQEAQSPTMIVSLFHNSPLLFSFVENLTCTILYGVTQ